jgi:hypothetical protein
MSNSIYLKLALISMLLTACGGSTGNSSSDGSSSDSDGSTSSTDNSSGSDGSNSDVIQPNKPITPFTLEYESIDYIYKAGSNGDIQVIKGINTFNNITDYYWDYSVNNGPLEIVDVQRTESMTFDCPASAEELAGKGTSLVTYFYNKNMVIDKFISSGHKIDCSYPITGEDELFKKTTIFGDTDVIGLLNLMRRYNRNNESESGKSCPDYDDTVSLHIRMMRKTISNYADCKVKIIRNYIMKDATGKMHKLAFSIQK